LSVDVQAAQYTIPGLIEAIVQRAGEQANSAHAVPVL
jgi:hypothetical protein